MGYFEIRAFLDIYWIYRFFFSYLLWFAKIIKKKIAGIQAGTQESYTRHKDFCLLGGLESSGQILISSNGKTKRI